MSCLVVGMVQIVEPEAKLLLLMNILYGLNRFVVLVL